MSRYNSDLFWKNVLSSDKKEAYIRAVRAMNESINAYIEFNPDGDNYTAAVNAFASDADTELRGIPCAIKNNIALENTLLSCASELLSDFKSPITASAVQQLLRDGVVPVGITNMDEYGMGSDTTHTIYGTVKNPWDMNRTAGGSSGGSAAAVSSGSVPFALGSDTGGSVRQPAVFGGLWGLKPTYGAVSRYGLVAFASSLDVIGVIAEHPRWLAPVFESMRVHHKDDRDASAYYPEEEKDMPSTTVKKVALCYSKDFVDSDVQEGILHAKRQYMSAGYEIDEIDLSFTDYSPAVYLNIAAAEASSNLARFDGIRYGKRGGHADNRIELVRNARNNGFGDEVKLRVITGGFVLRSGFQDQFYLKALKLRNHLKKQLYKVFNTYDIVLMPVVPTPAFFLGKVSSFQQKLADAYSVVANLSGVPAVAYPVMYKDGVPVGIQALAPPYGEKRLCTFINDTYHLFEYRISPVATQLNEQIQRDTRGPFI